MITSKCTKILIVEDERIVAVDLKNRLTKLDYQITGLAADSDKALTLINQDPPDIILMDIRIQGGLDGIETAALLQRTHSIPVIYLTAYSEQQTLNRAIATKPYGYLLKPFSDRELHITIQVSLERFASDTQFRKNEQHFRLALEAAHLGTWEITSDSQEVNLGKSPDGHLYPLLSWKHFFAVIDKNDQSRVNDFIDSLRKNKVSTAEIEFRVATESPQDYWFKLYGKSFHSNALNHHQTVGILQEITESRQIQNELAQAAAVFKYAVEGIIVLDKNRYFTCANDAFFGITGFQAADLLEKELPFLTEHNLGKHDYDRIWQTVDQSGYWLGEVAAVKHDSEPIYIWLSIGLIPVESARDQRFVVMISDITGIRETEKQLSQIAYYDSLTNLPNRMLIMDRLKQSIAQAARDSSLLGVLFIDLDNFKRINDTLGHNNGDTLLFFVSQKMQAVLRQSDTLGRLGGDEFIVIVTHVESHEGLIRVAEKIRESLASPIIIDNIEIVPSCSIGISLYPDHSIHSDELVQMADTAMYEAKNKGRNSFAFYHRSLTQKAAHHLTRERELYHALTQRQFRLHYQPQFSPSKQKITGVEALIRWQHPHKGLLSPAEIIPVAETSRLIIEIGNWVLTEACQQLSEWRDMGIDDLRIAVNLSIRQLADKNLMKFIADLLQQYAIPAHLLELEITESCLQDELLYINSLEQLDKQGIPISIDDFGTGYSCLSSLKNLPIQRLKIDKSFVQGIPEDSNDCAIASAIQVLAQKLGLQVIAEGIETMEQIHFLTQLGCDELQGYLLSKPVAPERIPEIIRTLPAELQMMTS